MTGTFALLEAGDDRWRTLWERWPTREVWAHPSYAKLYDAGGAQAVCASWEGADGCVLYPMLLRNLETEPWWKPSLGPATDIVSPYGYGGPFFWGRDRVSVAAVFWPSFREWADRVGVVSEFVRFSLFPDDLLPYPGETEISLQNAVRDLSADPDALWMDVGHKVRKNVKRAQREGVTVMIDPAGARLREFLSLYHRTMGRRGAGEEYFFPLHYFETIVRTLPGQHAFFHAFHAGRMVSTELVLRSATSVYSFLGGSDERAYSVRPNDLLKWEIVLWAQREKLRRFVLGGGLEMEDGIFRHKLAFAP
ncbi:MAG: GNAT family N-acetyltransferase, partial [Actinomycetota bacterium]|nr:GNAT family N-acetyltransferase [Actinomycetota bacterium]